MNCPLCNVPLQTAERQGVEVNCCPDCQGVWICRGGLDKIIDRSGVPGGPADDKRASEREPDELHGKSFLSNLFG